MSHVVDYRNSVRKYQFLSLNFLPPIEYKQTNRTPTLLWRKEVGVHDLLPQLYLAIHGYKSPRGPYGRPSIITPNKLQREFTVEHPYRAWVTHITYIRTWQGWLYLAVVMDLFTRKVVGWSMKPTLARALVLDAILMAVWRRRPKQKVLIHSDQGTQYGSDDWQRFCRNYNLEPSESRGATAGITLWWNRSLAV